jgi:hypothetical protein
MIRLAKLALWALQDDCVASAWRPYDNHVCGAVVISAGKKKDKKKQKIGRNRDSVHFFLLLATYQMSWHSSCPSASLISRLFLSDALEKHYGLFYRTS